MYKNWISLFFLLLWYSTNSNAQRFPFYNLTVENGLIQSQATCLTQDKLGNLWVGTLGGLSRYDGKKIKNYTVNDGLLANSIVDIEVLPPSLLLISTGNAVQLFDGSVFSTVLLPTKMAATRVNSFLRTKNNRVFCLINGALAELKIAAKKIIVLDSSHFYISLQQVNKSLMLSDAKGQIFSLDPEAKKLNVNTILDSSGRIVLKIFEDSKSNIWCLTSKGLFLLIKDKLQFYEFDKGATITAPLLSAAEDAQHNIWFASIQGAFRIKDGQLSYFNQQNGLSSNIISRVFCDQEGNIWLSSDGEGVFRYSGGPFISFDESMGLPNKQVTSIAGDEQNTIYMGSYQGRLSSYQLGETIRNINTQALQNDGISALKYQNGYGLWVATRNNGLFLYTTKNGLNKFNHPLWPKQAKAITTLFVDDLNRLWVAVQNSIIVLDNNQLRSYDLKPGTIANCITQIGSDSILLATRAGLYLLHSGRFVPWKPEPILEGIEVQAMVKKADKLFVGTSEKGVLVLDIYQNKASQINSKNGLGSDFVYNLLLDSLGQLWAGTGKGICKVQSPESEHPIITIYGKPNGVIGLESNSSASFIDKNGQIWFGTTEGVSCFFTSALPTHVRPISIVLESVKLFGGKDIDTTFYKGKKGWYGIPQNLSLPYRYNNISFAFQAVTLSPVDKILYRYLLEGTNNGWSEWSEENAINFSSLEPGNYVLKVMCKVQGELQNAPVLEYAFEIKTPFYKSIWFVVAIILLAILCGVYLQYSANKRKQKRLKREELLRKEEQQRVRERTAEDFHDELGNKLTRINVLTSVLKSKIDMNNADAERIILQIQDNTQQLYSGTRDILWSLHPSNDNLHEIVNHVSDLARELFSETDIVFNCSGNDEWFKSYKMPLDKSRNFIMIWKEALNNCLKYGHASHVLLQVKMLPNKKVQVRLTDDGCGFDGALLTKGNGLNNMKSRAKRLDAELEILSANNKGTQIILILPEIK